MPLKAVGQRRVDQIVAALRNAGSARGKLPEQLETRSPSRRSEDLEIVHRLLEDLEQDLSSSAETLRSHYGTMPILKTAQQLLAAPELEQQSRYQFIDSLGEIFECIRELEDELTACTDTLVRHSYKLQHLDLAMQMLTEVSAEALNSDDDTSKTPRLHNLRTACEHALTLQ
ncbi:hypothetical protein G7077_12645 [Sphingomonas piscis]|uniref:Uncharacterized protein n=1 Tax=Sphingomonas piscis TaxID=2714943 RepID=A0A6G7YSA7_9SPHN|nr:hypothetical protein [Sphingomonas piscis]QIK79626.1 hypothetical protein G7077_12645 [Sphingomonas piscis]